MASQNDAIDVKDTLGNQDPLISAQTTKYDLSLRIKNKRASYKQLLPTCPTLRSWDVQNKYKFGFIPLGEIKLLDKVSPSHTQEDPIALHTKIKASGYHNFMGKQVNIPSQLNPDTWDSLLSNYWDKQLPLLIRFGFPLDYDRSGNLISHNENHTSSKTYPEDIQAYLDEEVQYNAILGPFQDPPIADLYTSPMMTRDKPNAVHRRIIVELSFLMRNSVNSGIAKDKYLGTPFILKLPTIDTITNQVRALGRGCMLYKIDISCAFRHIKLDPIDYDLLGLHHERHYIDTCLLFGYRNGSAIFNV